MTKCRWCDEPAIGAVEVEPARYKLKTAVVDGKRVSARVIARNAIMADACAVHARMVNEQPQSMGTRRYKRPPQAQTTIFDV